MENVMLKHSHCGLVSTTERGTFGASAMAGLAARGSALSAENVLVVVPFLFDTFSLGGKEKVYCKHLSDINKMDYHSAIPNHSVTSNLTYGIYITEGTQMDDFGRDGGHPLNYTACSKEWLVDNFRSGKKV